MYDINTAAQPQQTQQYSPEMIQAILALQQTGTQRKDIARQQQMAQALREQGQAGTRATSPGGGRVGAPNWAGTLANIYAAKKAGAMDATAEKDMASVNTNETKNLAKYFQMQQVLQARKAAELDAEDRRRQQQYAPPQSAPQGQGVRGSYVDDGVA